MRLAIVLALVACGSPQSPSIVVPPSGPVAGMRWMTATQPWRTNEAINALVAIGPTAIVGGSDGWIAEIDLASGLVVRETKIGTLSITDLVELTDHRILAVGLEDERAAAVVLAPGTLAPTAVDLGAVKGEGLYYGVHAQVVTDGSVAIAGPGIPLATYDPATWKPRVFSPDLNWKELAVTADAIYATHGYTSFRAELSTGTPAQYRERVQLAAGASVVTRGYDKGKSFTESRKGDAAPLRFRDLGFSPAIDRPGLRLADLAGNTVTVFSLTDGTAIARFDLGPWTVGGAHVWFSGDRLLVAQNTFVRVIDLRSGYITPRGLAPAGGIAQLTVADDGSVVAISSEVTRFVGGKVVTTEPVGGPAMQVPPGDVPRFGTYTPSYSRDQAAAVVTVRNLGDGRVQTWRPSRKLEDAWLGRNGEIAVLLEWRSDKPRRFQHSDGKQLGEGFVLHDDASVDDVDVDAGLAAISRKGTTHLVDLVTGVPRKVTVRAPQCSEYPSTVIERGGRRIATWEGREVILWDRETGEVVGSFGHTEDVYEPTFLPGRDEVVVHVRDGFMLWSPKAQELRTATIPHLGDVELSPNGKHLAVSLRDGRIAVADFAVARAALPVTKASSASAPPASCGDFDPFEPEPEHAGDASDD